MGPSTPLDFPLTAAPQDSYEEDPEARPDVADLLGEPAAGTLGPELEPEAYDAAILAGLITP
jgi:hypothetical protein